MKKLRLDQIRIDGGTQQRSIDQDTIEAYVPFLDKMPPVEVMQVDKEYFLWDGFHRYHTAIKKGIKSLPANIRTGELRDAVWLSLGANATHGKRRTSAEVRRIVRFVLDDPKWRKKSLRAIAEHVGVSSMTVQRIKKGDEGDNVTLLHEEDEEVYENNNRDPEPLKDQVGTKVPKKITEVFLRRGKIIALIAKLDEVKRAVAAMVEDKDAVAAWVNMPGFKADLANVRRNLKAATPYAVCPYCKATGTKCKVCKKHGFVGKLIYDNAPKEMKKKGGKK